MRVLIKISFIFFFTSALFITNDGVAQFASRETVNQSTEWFVLNSAIKLHRKFGFTFDGQLRFVQGFENAQHFLRNGLEIYINPNFSLVPLGYMYVWNFQYGKQPAAFVNNEQRIWQQLMYKHRHKNFFFQHRLRMEERFLQAHHVAEDGTIVYDGYDTYLNRIRYRLQVQIPLNRQTLEKGAWFAAVFDEVFYGWGEGDTYNRPDQNRIYVALGKQVTGNFRIEGGGFYQMLIKKNGEQQENNLGAMVQFTYNLDFTTADD